jgi:hypothetical protein
MGNFTFYSNMDVDFIGVLAASDMLYINIIISIYFELDFLKHQISILFHTRMKLIN